MFMLQLEPYDITELGMLLDVLQATQIQPLLDAQQINRARDAKEQLEKDRTEKERLAKSYQNILIHDLSESDESESETSSVDEPPKLYRSSSKKSFAKATEKLRSLKQQKQDQKQEQAQGQQPQPSQQPQQNLIRLLQQLLVTHLRIRDKERMMGLVFQGVTGEIFKELISIFYEPLVKVYKSANVADSLMDVKDFADELIKIVEQADANDGNFLLFLATRYMAVLFYVQFLASFSNQSMVVLNNRWKGWKAIDGDTLSESGQETPPKLLQVCPLCPQARRRPLPRPPGMVREYPFLHEDRLRPHANRLQDRGRTSVLDRPERVPQDSRCCFWQCGAVEAGGRVTETVLLGSQRQETRGGPTDGRVG